MAKNSAMLIALKRVEEQRKMELLNMYGGLAIALARIGIPSDQICGLFEMTEEIWNQCVEEGRCMADWASEEAGVNIYMIVEKEK